MPSFGQLLGVLIGDQYGCAGGMNLHIFRLVGHWGDILPYQVDRPSFVGHSLGVIGTLMEDMHKSNIRRRETLLVNMSNRR